MAEKCAPHVSACGSGDNWTCITFSPDLSKFGLTRLEDDDVALMRKRVYDMAGVLGKGVKVQPKPSLRHWTLTYESASANACNPKQHMADMFRRMA